MGKVNVKKAKTIKEEKQKEKEAKEKEKQKKLDDYNAMLDKIDNIDDLKNNFVELLELAKKVK